MQCSIQPIQHWYLMSHGRTHSTGAKAHAGYKAAFVAYVRCGQFDICLSPTAVGTHVQLLQSKHLSHGNTHATCIMRRHGSDFGCLPPCTGSCQQRCTHLEKQVQGSGQHSWFSPSPLDGVGLASGRYAVRHQHSSCLMLLHQVPHLQHHEHREYCTEGWLQRNPCWYTTR